MAKTMVVAVTVDDAVIKRAALIGARILRDTINSPNQADRAEQIIRAALAEMGTVA